MSHQPPRIDVCIDNNCKLNRQCVYPNIRHTGAADSPPPPSHSSWAFLASHCFFAAFCNGWHMIIPVADSTNYVFGTVTSLSLSHSGLSAILSSIACWPRPGPVLTYTCVCVCVVYVCVCVCVRVCVCVMECSVRPQLNRRPPGWPAPIGRRRHGGRIPLADGAAW